MLLFGVRPVGTDISHVMNLLQLLLRLLQVFARGLCDSGYRDEAAAVYCNLLRSGCDKAQQADLLRRCLQVVVASGRTCAYSYRQSC